jgi:DsbC/DsbD-like thiol-disulfide interchange protein
MPKAPTQGVRMPVKIMKTPENELVFKKEAEGAMNKYFQPLFIDAKRFKDKFYKALDIIAENYPQSIPNWLNQQQKRALAAKKLDYILKKKGETLETIVDKIIKQYK